MFCLCFSFASVSLLFFFLHLQVKVMVDAVIFMLHPASVADRGVLFFTCPSVHPFIQARYFGNE